MAQTGCGQLRRKLSNKQEWPFMNKWEHPLNSVVSGFRIGLNNLSNCLWTIYLCSCKYIDPFTIVVNSDVIYLSNNLTLSYWCSALFRLILLFVPHGCIAHTLCPSVGSAAPCTEQLRTAPPPPPSPLSQSAAAKKPSRIPQRQKAWSKPSLCYCVTV